MRFYFNFKNKKILNITWIPESNQFAKIADLIQTAQLINSKLHLIFNKFWKF